VQLSSTTLRRARAGRATAHPLALTVDVADAGVALSEIKVTLKAELHPSLAEAARNAGAHVTTRGWTLEARRGASLDRLLAAIPLGHLVPQARVKTALARDRLLEVPRSVLATELRDSIRCHPQWGEHPFWSQIRNKPLAELGRRVKTDPCGGLIALERDDDTLKFTVGLLEPLTEDGRQLDLGVLGHSATQTTVSLPEVLDWTEVLTGVVEVIDHSDGAIAEIARGLDGRVHATPLMGAPGLALVVTGRRRADRRIVPADEAVALAADDQAAEVADHVNDVAAMGRAQAVGRTGLYDYQDQFVSIYASATQHGLVNALSPGMGKTICAAAALKARHAQLGRPGRALVVVPSPLRLQWKEELAKHYPQCVVAVAMGGDDISKLPSSWGQPQHLVVVISYELARRHADTLTAGASGGLGRWDDLVVDEAALLRRQSARSRALWQLRSAASRCMTLTGTPIERSLTDLEPLVSFSRGNNDLFKGVSLQSRAHYGLATALGPVVFRSNSDVLPGVEWVFESVDLSDAERELHDLLFDKLGASLGRKQGLAGHNAVSRALALVRQAVCDPAAVADAHIPVELQARLPGRGDSDQIPAKRWLALQLIDDHPGSVLVCTDFPKAAIALADDLNRYGIPSVAFTSKLSPSRRRRVVEQFQAGDDLRVLVLSGLGKLGLNLQRASMVVHYDPPLDVATASQRMGRAVRLGQHASDVAVVTLIARHAIDEALLGPVEALARGGDWLELAARDAMKVSDLAELAWRHLNDAATAAIPSAQAA
jgi:superfamily II DNA or RNA helicase